MHYEYRDFVQLLVIVVERISLTEMACIQLPSYMYRAMNIVQVAFTCTGMSLVPHVACVIRTLTMFVSSGLRKLTVSRGASFVGLGYSTVDHSHELHSLWWQERRGYLSSIVERSHPEIQKASRS